MASFLDNVRFNPTLGGTTDWTYSSAVTGYQSPAAAGAVNATKYKYFAISADQTQWELGEGAYNTTGPVLPRTTILFNSLGTTAKINFAAAPQVAIVALAEDLPTSDGAGNFSGIVSLNRAAGVAIQGTNTNDSAATGFVGEFISSNIAAASAVALVTGVEKTVTSISVPAGDWDVEGNVAFDCTISTNFTGLGGFISGTTNTSPTPPNNTAPFGGGGMNQIRFAAFVSGATTFGFFPTGKVRVSLSTTTTIFLIAFANFTASTCKAYGHIGARRVR